MKTRLIFHYARTAIIFAGCFLRCFVFPIICSSGEPPKKEGDDGRTSPEASLSLIIEQVQESNHDAEYLSRSPWLRISVMNNGAIPWYRDMEAEDHGLKLIIVGKAGNPMRLNEQGKGKAVFKNLHNGRRTGVFLREHPARVDIGLCDYCKIESGRSYTVIVEWTLNVHEINPAHKHLDPAWTHRITLKSKPVTVRKPTR